MTGARLPVVVDVPAADFGVYREHGSMQVVFLSGLWLASPTFHRRATWLRSGTVCGRDLRVDDDTAGWRLLGTWLPLRHALKFARPCRRCWP